MPTVTPAKKTATQKAVSKSDRAVIYPTVTFQPYWSGEGGLGPITHKLARQFLGWETEAEYAARRIKDNPKLKEKELKFREFLLRDGAGEKVVCSNNNKNRPFDEGNAKRLAQVILNREWAGPLNFPGETCNGEDILIDRTGEVISGQHTLAGLIFAWEIWSGVRKVKGGDQSGHWHDLWPEDQFPDGPVIEKGIKFGLSSDPRIIRTIDNVRPRSLSDVFYTSPLFAKLKTSSQRRECSEMLQAAVKVLWSRTGADEDRFLRYMTHAVACDWVDRHKKLLNCVAHIYEENSGDGRALSNLSLRPGVCAALMYLAASGESDGDAYRNAEPPSEKKMNFDRMDKAGEFWSLIGTCPDFEAVREGLAVLVDPANPSSDEGRQVEKTVLLAKAWKAFLDGAKEIAPSDVELHYETGADGLLHLMDWDDFGGIDLGEPKSPDKDSNGGDEEPPEEEVENGKAEAAEKKRRKAEEVEARLQAAKRKKNGKAEDHVPDGSIMDWEPPVEEAEVDDEPTAEGDPSVEDEMSEE